MQIKPVSSSNWFNGKVLVKYTMMKHRGKGAVVDVQPNGTYAWCYEYVRYSKNFTDESLFHSPFRYGSIEITFSLTVLCKDLL